MRKKLVLALVIAASSALPACQRRDRTAPAEPVDAFFAQQGLTRTQAWGRYIYDLDCAVCHGPQGHGDGKNAYTLDPTPPDLALALRGRPAAYSRQIITGGTASVGRSPLCPAWGRTLSTDDIDSVVAYLDLLARTPEPRRRPRR